MADKKEPSEGRRRGLFGKKEKSSGLEASPATSPAIASPNTSAPSHTPDSNAETLKRPGKKARDKKEDKKEEASGKETRFLFKLSKQKKHGAADTGEPSSTGDDAPKISPREAGGTDDGASTEQVGAKGDQEATSTSTSTPTTTPAAPDTTAKDVTPFADEISDKGSQLKLEREESFQEVFSLFSAFRAKEKMMGSMRVRKLQEREALKQEIKAEIREEMKEEVKREVQHELEQRSSSVRRIGLGSHRTSAEALMQGSAAETKAPPAATPATTSAATTTTTTVNDQNDDQAPTPAVEEPTSPALGRASFTVVGDDDEHVIVSSPMSPVMTVVDASLEVANEERAVLMEDTNQLGEGEGSQEEEALHEGEGEGEDRPQLESEVAQATVSPTQEPTTVAVDTTPVALHDDDQSANTDLPEPPSQPQADETPSQQDAEPESEKAPPPDDQGTKMAPEASHTPETLHTPESGSAPIENPVPEDTTPLAVDENVGTADTPAPILDTEPSIPPETAPAPHTLDQPATIDPVETSTPSEEPAVPPTLEPPTTEQTTTSEPTETTTPSEDPVAPPVQPEATTPSPTSMPDAAVVEPSLDKVDAGADLNEKTTTATPSTTHTPPEGGDSSSAAPTAPSAADVDLTPEPIPTPPTTQNQTTQPTPSEPTPASTTTAATSPTATPTPAVPATTRLSPTPTSPSKRAPDAVLTRPAGRAALGAHSMDLSRMDNETQARRRILLERKESSPNLAYKHDRPGRPALAPLAPLPGLDPSTSKKELNRQQFATLKRPPKKSTVPSAISATLSMLDLPVSSLKASAKAGKALKMKDVRNGGFTDLAQLEANMHSRFEEFMKEFTVRKSEKAKAHKLQFDPEQEKKIKDDAAKIIGALKAPPPVALVGPPPGPPPPPPPKQPPPAINIFKFGTDTDFTDLFGEVEETPGSVLVWAVEAFRPQRIPIDEHGGVFMSKNAYLVLHTSETDKALTFDLHMWYGKDAKADKRGSCAMLACQLGTHVHGAAHHREEQGDESDLFHGHFSTLGLAVQHEEGGMDADFARIDPDNPRNIPTIMYSIKRHGEPEPEPEPEAAEGEEKGRPRPGPGGVMRINRVAVSTTSLRDDCVLVFLSKDAIFQWNGKDAPLQAKIKGRTFTKELKVFHGNMAMRTTEMTHDHTTKEFIEAIERAERDWKAKAKGDEDGEGAEEPEEEEEEEDDQPVSLMKVSETGAGGKLDLVTVQEGYPLDHKHLANDQDVVIVDVTTEIFVWFGSTSTKRRKAAGLECAKLFFQNYYRPPWATIRRVRPGSEHPFFKSQFGRWPRKDPLPVFAKPPPKAGPPLATLLPNVPEIYAAARVPSHPVIAANAKGGKLEMWSLKKNGQPAKRLAPDQRGNVYAAENVLMLYTRDEEDADPECEIYFWQGHRADQKVFASFMFGFVPVLSTKLRNSGFVPPTPVQVHQQKESLQLMNRLDSLIVIRMGPRPDGPATASTALAMATSASGGPGATPAAPEGAQGVSMFQVRRTSAAGGTYFHVVEVPASVARLDSRDVFLIRKEDQGKVTLWRGSLSDQACATKAKEVAATIFTGVEVCGVDEGNEPDELWACLGTPKTWGHDDLFLPYYDTSAAAVAQYMATPIMFRCSNNTGKFEVARVDPFWVTDLQPESALVLDTQGEMVYLWTGDQARGSLSTLASLFAEEYVKTAQQNGRTMKPVVTWTDEPRKLPRVYKRHFLAWP